MRHVRNLQKLKVICKNLPLMCLTPLARRPRGCIVLRLRWSKCVKRPERTYEGNDMPSKLDDVHGRPTPLQEFSLSQQRIQKSFPANCTLLADRREVNRPSPELAFWTIGPESHSNYYVVAPGLHSIVESPFGDTGAVEDRFAEAVRSVTAFLSAARSPPSCRARWRVASR